MKKITLILPSLVLDSDTLVSLERHLKSLEDTTPRDAYQFIIIDNGSSFGSDLMKAKADIYIRKEEKLGYARAVNLGMALADEDIIVTSNNDIYFSKDWLPLMLETLEKYPGIVMPANINPPHDGIIPDDPWMSLWMITRETFNKVGFFDQFDLNWRYHDQEYCIKIKKAGLNVVRDCRVSLQFINSLTYNKLGKHNEESAESQIMLSRYGADMYVRWLQNERAKQNI